MGRDLGDIGAVEIGQAAVLAWFHTAATTHGLSAS